MERRFAHPQNSYVEAVGIGSFVLTMLFGPFYLAFRRAWFALLLTIFIGGPLVLFGTAMIGAASGGPLGWFLAYLFGVGAWALAMQPLICTSYLRRGWREVAI